MTHLNHYSQLLKSLLIALLTFFFSSLHTIHAQTVQHDRVHLGFIYPLSTHGTHAPLDTNDFSFHLISGVSAAERGLAFAGLTNVVRNDSHGIAFAGFSNHIRQKATGILFAGFVNTYGQAEGLSFAGFSNIASADVKGAQFAGFLNKASNVNGAQFAGFSNHAANVVGSQFAGFSNTARTVDGSQFAGFANISAKAVSGSQFGGFANIADSVKGSQFAGFINVARKVKGVQIAGFINIADSSDYPVGLINIVRNGEKSISSSYDETQTSLISFRSGGKALYGIVGLGYNFKNEDEVYAFEAGLGAHVFNTNYFRLNLELATIYIEGFRYGEYFKSSLRILPALRLGNRLELFGGPALHYINTNTSEGKALSTKYIYKHQNRWGDNFQAFYIGYTAGLAVTF
ncbi:MAG: hypothetical protein H7Y13_04465 [Sphingobacteriaceae bacterium]|nr:hypothetical protein [Sphingobacteriaceae bacterium]